MKDSSPKKEANLHKVEFYSLTPRSILHLKCNKSLLAVGRSDNSIEIWHCFSESFTLVRIIPPHHEGSLEGLAWINDRLFSINSAAQLIEWTSSGEFKKMMLVTGNSATCIDVSTANKQKLIVVGTEEGYINVFNAVENDFNYEKILDRQEGRIVCCSLTRNGEHLATGSIDCIRIWNVDTGHIVHKIGTGRSAAKRQTIVWAIKMLDDLTVFSGDSRGKLTIWDGQIGVQSESVAVSKADLLSLVLTDDERTLFCAGVEPIIKKYVLTTIKKDEQDVKKWVRDVNRNIHSHDIHALECFGKKLISGGIEGCLTVSSHPPRTVYRYSPFLPRPSSLSNNDLLLLRYANHLEVWKLGAPDDQLLEENTFALKEPPKKLLALKSKLNQMMLDAKISPDGTWVAYTTNTVSRLFKFNSIPNQKSELTPVEAPPEFSLMTFIEFTSDSKYLFGSTNTRSVEILDMETLTHKTTIDCSENVNGFITSVILTKCGKYFAVVTTSGQIGLWQSERGKWKHLLNLPQHKYTPTAVAFRPDTKKISVAYSDLRLIEYDFKEMRFNLSLDLTREDVSNRYPINSIVFHPKNENVFILQTETNIYSVRTVSENDEEDVGRLKKRTKENAMERNGEKTYAVVKKIKEIQFIGQLLWHGDADLVAICMNYGQLVEQLPPALKMKKFGIS